MEATSVWTKKIRWEKITFFSILTLLSFVGVPIYVFHYGITRTEIILFVFYYVATGMSITVGYHRLLAHASFRANSLVQFVLLFFGAAAFANSALRWASEHRDHHRYVDREPDPYNIQKGFFHAHMGWLLFWEHRVNYDNVKDLQKSKLIRSQHQYYPVWATVSGILIPLVVGLWSGRLMGAFLLGICLRMTLVYHANFCVNSVCHKFGRATYDNDEDVRDNWLVSLATFGEGYHSFHHRFPGDYRNGVRWYQWDPSKWMIALLSRFGFAWSLTRASREQIVKAQRTVRSNKNRKRAIP